MSLYQIIKDVQEASAKGGAKKAVLEANRDNLLLRQFLKAVYDPRINYYHTKLPKVVKWGTEEFSVETLKFLGRLASRELSGKVAKAAIQTALDRLTPEGQELFALLIGRDIRAGAGEGTILSVFPGLFYVPPYQRCAKLDEKTKAKFAALKGFYVQTKSDGTFCYAIRDRGDTKTAMSRTGSIYPAWVGHHITYGMPEGSVAMGEMLVVRDDLVLDRKTGNGILNSVLTGDGSKFKDTDSLKFVAWDMVTEDEFLTGKSERPYKERWRKLLECTAINAIPCWWVESVHAAGVIQAEHLARKEEGTVWKTEDMLWRDCQSGDPDMVKAKLVFQAEYEIESVYEGEGKAAGMLGGFCVKTRDGLIRFSVGSGFSDDQRKELWAYRDTLPGRVCVIEGNDIVTSKGRDTEAVFLPIVVEPIRTDKAWADSRDEVWAEFEAAKLGQKL